MENQQLKIILSAPTGVYKKDIKTQLIDGIENIRFSNNIGGGQGEVDLTIMEKYDNTDYYDKQLVEIALYNKEYPTGFLQYCGFVKNINRKYSQENGESIYMEILGIGSLLGEYSGTLNTTGALNTVLDTLITQFHTICNITNAMEFLGSNIFKNGVIDITTVTINITGTYFDILKGIFDSIKRTFCIDKDGTIYLGDNRTTEHLLTINKDIIDFNISSSRESEITLVGNNYDIIPGDKISILNINSNYNMNGARIEKVEFSLTETKLYLGKLFALGTVIDGTIEVGYLFSDYCDSIEQWINSGLVVTTNGNPNGNCFTAGLNKNAHTQNTAQKSDFTYEYDVIVNTSSIIDFFFGCDMNGVGYMFRVDTRTAGTGYQILPTTNWITWGTNLIVSGTATAATWYKCKIIVTAIGVVKCYINGTLVLTYNITVKGNWIGVNGDGIGTGGRIDNIIGY